jgi:hypothetical protein
MFYRSVGTHRTRYSINSTKVLELTYEATLCITPNICYSPGSSNHRRRFIDINRCETLKITLVTVFVDGGKINYLKSW